MTIARDALERSINARLLACSHDELRVIDRVLSGIELGRESYGPLDLSTDARLMKREAAMELRDFLFYAAAIEVARDDEDRERVEWLAEELRRDWDRFRDRERIEEGLEELATAPVWRPADGR